MIQQGERTVVIVGLAGAGKTFIAEKLHKEFPHYKLFHTDDYMEYGFNDALNIIFHDIMMDTSEYKIIEGIQCYRLLLQGIGRKFFPHLVINVLATSQVRGQRRPDKDYKQMDATFRVMWLNYNRGYNPRPPRVLDIINE